MSRDERRGCCLQMCIFTKPKTPFFYPNHGRVRLCAVLFGRASRGWGGGGGALLASFAVVAKGLRRVIARGVVASRVTRDDGFDNGFQSTLVGSSTRRARAGVDATGATGSTARTATETRNIEIRVARSNRGAKSNAATVTELRVSLDERSEFKRNLKYRSALDE